MLWKWDLAKTWPSVICSRPPVLSKETITACRQPARIAVHKQDLAAPELSRLSCKQHHWRGLLATLSCESRALPLPRQGLHLPAGAPCSTQWPGRRLPAASNTLPALFAFLCYIPEATTSSTCITSPSFTFRLASSSTPTSLLSTAQSSERGVSELTLKEQSSWDLCSSHAWKIRL